MTLAFFCDGTNTVIAHDVEDAKRVYLEFIGEPWVEEESGEHEWQPGSWDGNTPTLVSCRFDGWEDVPIYAKAPPLAREVVGRAGVTFFMTPEEWIAGHGRGFFGSTEV